ncbi:MAG: molecular chaperone HtpG [Firmicutes bacterium HGW-Firmicutes-2]|jgi:molecular chaperone HtpG|nr:MAG: molecular chaperone HtpG [Firmicutes bacterium HGW-Firmicutes-2]
MSIEKGSLSIHSENIFPIIKKWLYSDHDIFVRELISNGSDAITKLRKLATMGEVDLPSDEAYKIVVRYDEKADTLTFTDNGIGLTGEEVKKYINQIAFSGAEDFLNTYKDKADSEQIIGHFGLGFYSAFMVAGQVEIKSLSYKQDATPIHWTCDGGTEFELEDGDRSERGTDIILHLGEDGKEFKNAYKIKSTIEKYCSFMPYEIYFEEVGKEEVETEKDIDADSEDKVVEPKPLNEISPLYLKQPSECTDEEYKAFYRDTFMDFKEPLFWIHLNMDYPFNLKGILYFPKLGNEFENIEGQIKLYNSQVFVAQNIKEVIPEFLLLLKGVIDCPDLPLNVSRSFLQNDGFVKKISDYISKKVADRLKSLYKSDKPSYEKFWGDIHPFIKFGGLRDEKFYDKVKDIILYKTTTGDYVVLSDYLERNKEKHENKVYYVTDPVQQAQYIKMFKDHDMEAVILEHSIDQAFISHIEAKTSDVKFARIDADLTDVMKETIHEDDQEAHNASAEQLQKLFAEVLSKEDIKVQLESLKSEDISAVIVLAEESRRMQDMSKMYGFMGMGLGDMPSDETLILNKKNKIVEFILTHHEEAEKKEDVKLFCEHLYDLALMSHKPLDAEGMTKFIQRSQSLLTRMI